MSDAEKKEIFKAFKKAGVKNLDFQCQAYPLAAILSWRHEFGLPGYIKLQWSHQCGRCDRSFE